MTCIVGLVHDEKVYVGGDTLAMNGAYRRHQRVDCKVWASDGFVYGFTQSFRMGQLLRYKFDPPHLKSGRDLMEFMVGPFVDAVRLTFKDGGWSGPADEYETESDRGGQFMVGTQGRLFVIEGDFQVAEHVDGLAALGCGDEFALGALHVAKGTPRQRIRLALEAAERFSAGVRGPFTIEAT